MHLKKKLTFFLVLLLGLLALTQARSIAHENENAELSTTTVTNAQETVSEAEQPEEIGLLGCGGSCGFPFGGHFDAQQFQSQFQNGGWGGSQFQSQSQSSGSGGSQFQSQSQSGGGGSQYQIQSQSGGGSQIQIGGGGSQFQSQSQSGGGGNQFQSQYSGW